MKKLAIVFLVSLLVGCDTKVKSMVSTTSTQTTKTVDILQTKIQSKWYQEVNLKNAYVQNAAGLLGKEYDHVELARRLEEMTVAKGRNIKYGKVKPWKKEEAREGDMLLYEKDGDIVYYAIYLGGEYALHSGLHSEDGTSNISSIYLEGYDTFYIQKPIVYKGSQETKSINEPRPSISIPKEKLYSEEECNEIEWGIYTQEELELYFDYEMIDYCDAND